MKDKTELQGVRGWLLFLVIMLCVLSPLAAIGSMANTFMGLGETIPDSMSLQWHHYKTLIWALLGFCIALNVTAGAGLLTIRSPSSVRFTIGVLWGIVVIGTIGTYMIVDVVLGQKSAAATTGVIMMHAFRSGSWALLWTLYLISSRRVKNTYYGSREPVATAWPES